MTERLLTQAVVESQPLLTPPEPRAFFIFLDGSGIKKKEEITFTQIRERISQEGKQSRLIHHKLKELHGRRNRLEERGVTGSGKSYNTTERRQILKQISGEETDINTNLAKAKKASNFLQRLAKWLLVSPGEQPLTVRLEDNQEGHLVDGTPLKVEEAHWRLFVINEVPKTWDHLQIALAKEYFLICWSLKNPGEKKPEELKEAELALQNFQKEKSEMIPDNLAPVFRKITGYDFRKPLLPELETLKELLR